MAQGATIYAITVELADVDRGVYETLPLRLARHPSEGLDYLAVRLLAYCLEYTAGIAFGQGVGTGDEPAIWVRDAGGQPTAWVEVGLPDAERLHRGSKLCGRAAVYTHRDVGQLLAQLAGRRIHRAAEIPVYAFDRHFIAGLAAASIRSTGCRTRRRGASHERRCGSLYARRRVGRGRDRLRRRRSDARPRAL